MDVRCRWCAVEGDFLGCLLDPGIHRVTLRFMPRSFVYGSIVSAFGAVALVGILLASRFNGRARVPAGHVVAVVDVEADREQASRR